MLQDPVCCSKQYWLLQEDKVMKRIQAYRANNCISSFNWQLSYKGTLPWQDGSLKLEEAVRQTLQESHAGTCAICRICK